MTAIAHPQRDWFVHDPNRVSAGQDAEQLEIAARIADFLNLKHYVHRVEGRDVRQMFVENEDGSHEAFDPFQVTGANPPWMRVLNTHKHLLDTQTSGQEVMVEVCIWSGVVKEGKGFSGQKGYSVVKREETVLGIALAVIIAANVMQARINKEL